MEVSEEGFLGHPLPLQFRETRFVWERSLAMDVMRRATTRLIARGLVLSVFLAMVEDTELTTTLGGADLHPHLDYLRHLDSLG